MIRVGIVDDHAIVRTGLKQLLCDEVDFRVSARPFDCREALDLVRSDDVDALLLDICMPDQTGEGAQVVIKGCNPDLPVLIEVG